VREKADKEIKALARALKVPKAVIYSALFLEEGREVLGELEKKYENGFRVLLEEIRKINSKLILMYSPSFRYIKRAKRREITRSFYKKLAKKYDIPFVDLTEDFLIYPPSLTTLLPQDGHLSRFGSKLIAKKLSKFLDKNKDYRANFKFISREKVFGDLERGLNTVRIVIPALPYRVTTNSQGLRMGYDISFPKKKQRILILGDSYTFGMFLNNQDSYPAILDTKYPDREVINGGVIGYTVTDEASMFIERSKYLEPDITVLQALDNDITELFAFKQNQPNGYNKHRKISLVFPSEAEIRLIDGLINKQSYISKQSSDRLQK